MLLNTHTYYSYKFGTWKPEELLKRAVEFGYTQICITDINSTSAVIECVRLAKQEVNIRVIAGIDFRNGADQKFVAIPKNNRGYRIINEFLTHHLHHNEPIPDVAPHWDDVWVVYPFSQLSAISRQLLIGSNGELKTDRLPLIENQFIGIRPHDIPQLRLSPLRHHLHKLVMLPTVSFEHQRDFNTHRLLRSIDKNLLLSKLERSEEGDPRHTLRPKVALLEYYRDFPEIVRNTEAILEPCEVDFEFQSNKNKQIFTGSKHDDVELLRSEAVKGLRYRYTDPDQKVLDRVEHELKVINQMGFGSYFLINWDIINYARSKGYFHVGRGSGANSLIAYLLRITDVDPVELDLYFERFINPYRTSPPDFDIDFSWTDRNDVTKYMFDTHGWDHVALQATYSTFKDRAVSRELGKVLGVPATEIDQLQKMGVRHNIGKYGDLILKYGRLIQNFPSHLSIHSSGILISEEPISAYSPTFMPPKGFPTIQFDMIIAEDLGLYKFDILSQRGLGKIKDSIAIIRDNTGDEVDVHDIKRFKQDEKIKTLLREARAIGCFYVESPAMRLLLTKLRADDYIGLVAASSVIRPGVAKSGMMREYIMRFRDKDRREAARKAIPELYEILAETYGVMVYQEDVIRVAHYFADLDLADADILRRGMSWKFKQRNEFHRVKERFWDNCRKKGYSEELVKKVWFEVESFANFAFAKGHSASYAVESFQTLFLKAYYPIEYMVATVNNGGGFYRPELYIHEARMHGAEVVAPCVNRSLVETIVSGKLVTLGFHMIKDLDSRTVRLLIEHRENGCFKTITDFIDRVPIGIEQMELLVKVGAFRFTGKNKKELTWEVRLMMGKVPKKEMQPRLFTPQPRPYNFPDLYTAPLEDAFDQIELLGFPLCDPFMLSNRSMKGGILAADVPEYLDKTVVAYGYLVTARKTHTARGDTMYFGNFIDRKGFFLDTVHFPPVAKAYPFTGRGIYRVVGKVTEEFGCFQIEASEMHRMPYVEDPRYAEEPSEGLQKPKQKALEPEIATQNDNNNVHYFDRKK
ncbi:MAG: DNA polymerase III subunit alpha [Flavobacteriales bacterium]|nr:DNA polymerase III subunit alpha [Flavobacteriales bacterium]